MSLKHGMASKNFSYTARNSRVNSSPALYTFVPCNHHEHFRFFLAVCFVHILMIFFQRYMASLCTEWLACECVGRKWERWSDLFLIAMKYDVLSILFRRSNISPKPNLMLFKTISFISFFLRASFAPRLCCIKNFNYSSTSSKTKRTKKNLLSPLT